MSYRRLTRDEHFFGPGPKRILALDGGGLRGVLTLGYLLRIEALLRERHGGGADFRLCHYYDLIAGTSTGAIIAAALALGMSVLEVLAKYEALGREVFTKGWVPTFGGNLRPRYDAAKLAEHLQDVFGAARTLGDGDLQTGLLVVTKRLDTGSVWPLGNNPRGRYFKASADDTWISNGDYPLWKVVRASTAAPTFFGPEFITIADEPGKRPREGHFVDGGVSPHNNPALQALMYATIDGYRVNWATGAESLLLTSVGTGRAAPGKASAAVEAKAAIDALLSVMDDTSELVETILQWTSTSPTAREIDREVGTVAGRHLATEPLFTYLRYNVTLTRVEIEALVPGLPADVVSTLAEMDQPANLDALLTLGQSAAHAQVRPGHFSTVFDLRGMPS
jgi:uncharacterized protein